MWRLRNLVLLDTRHHRLSPLQLNRTRDCTDLDLLLHCRTRPIIESSVQLRFGCFDYAYRDLPAHMASAKLSYLHNFWSDVYDFTPPAAGRLNWTFLPDDRARVSVLLAPVPKEVVDMAVPDARELLRSWGARPARGDLAQPDAESLFVIFPPSASAKGAELIREVSSRSSSGRSLALLWTNDAKVTMDVALQLAAAAGWDKAAARQLTVGGGACVGAQLVGSKVEAGEVAQAARAASALVSGSRDAGSLFRELGIEG